LPRSQLPRTKRSETQQRDFLQIKLRDALVRQRVNLISSVRFMLKSLGVRLASPSTPTFAKHARTQLAEKDATLQVLETLNEKIRELDHQIEQLCEQAYPADSAPAANPRRLPYHRLELRADHP
jgi:transposase